MILRAASASCYVVGFAPRVGVNVVVAPVAILAARQLFEPILLGDARDLVERRADLAIGLRCGESSSGTRPLRSRRSCRTATATARAPDSRRQTGALIMPPIDTPAMWARLMPSASSSAARSAANGGGYSSLDLRAPTSGRARGRGTRAVGNGRGSLIDHRRPVRPAEAVGQHKKGRVGRTAVRGLAVPEVDAVDPRDRHRALSRRAGSSRADPRGAPDGAGAAAPA